jgi:phosphoribosyl-ATP pyrophosphohydrolase
MSQFSEILTRLQATIEARKGADPTSSYTAKLLAGGAPLAAKKFGEEAIETALAAVQSDPDAVAAKLEAREGRSGIEEKASRPAS